MTASMVQQMKRIKNAVMKMGGGDGACNDRTDVKTSRMDPHLWLRMPL